MNDDGTDWFYYAVLAGIAAMIVCMLFIPSCQPQYVDPRW